MSEWSSITIESEGETMNIIGKLTCILRGHKRGRKLPRLFSERELNISTYRCPRCGTTWVRETKAKKAA